MSRRVLALLCATFLSSPSAASICPYTFDPVPIAPQALFDAVFSIGKTSGGDYEHLGTAYLVDAEHRYLVTAEHVVKHASVGDDIAGRSDTFPAEEYIFRVLTKDTQNDLSILVPVSGYIPARLTAFDIRTRMPSATERLYAVGHPRFLDDYSRTHASPQYRRYRKIQPLMGTFELESNTLKGASGSPLFDEFGQVLGTITDNSTDRQLGFARPSHDLENLILGKYELSRFGKQLDQELRNGEITIDELARLLTVKPTNASNLDLARIAYNMINRPAEYPEASEELFGCPLLQSMLHRGLSVPQGQDVVRLLEDAKNGAILLGDQKTSEQSIEAVSYYSLAYEASIQAVHQLSETSDALAHSLTCASVEGGLEDAASLPNDLSRLRLPAAEPLDCSEATKATNRIGRLLADAARAKYSIWKSSEDSDALNNSRRIAALAVLVSDSPAVLGDAYSVFGISSVDMDQDDEARRAFGLAYLNGARQPWLQERIQIYEMNVESIDPFRSTDLHEYAEIALQESDVFENEPIT